MDIRPKILTAKKRIYSAFESKPPAHLLTQFRQPELRTFQEFEEILRSKYFKSTVSTDEKTLARYLDSDEGKADWINQRHKRLDGFRKRIIPWLDAAQSLKGAKILEIGCGTGSSTVALAEQGATVIAVDIDESSLRVAAERCRTYDVDVEIHQVNATELHRQFSHHKFDFIIYFACLEHMTHVERMSAMSDTWNMLAPGSHWCVIETPNRIWYHDHHTAWLPFYMWLPDDLAFKYARFSPRNSFSSALNEYSDEAFERMLRAGRGVSYHEFDLTLGDATQLDVVSSLGSFSRQRNRIWTYGRMLARSHNVQYGAFLRKICPKKLHPGFLDAALDIIIRKV